MDSVAIPRRFRGNVFVLVQTDAENRIDEFPGENNNTAVEVLVVDPLPPSDLVVSNVVVPQQVFDGSDIEVRYTVTNLGIGETDVDRWTDTIWLTGDKNRPGHGATPPGMAAVRARKQAVAASSAVGARDPTLVTVARRTSSSTSPRAACKWIAPPSSVARHPSGR